MTLNQQEGNNLKILYITSTLGQLIRNKCYGHTQQQRRLEKTGSLCHRHMRNSKDMKQDDEYTSIMEVQAEYDGEMVQHGKVKWGEMKKIRRCKGVESPGFVYME